MRKIILFPTELRNQEAPSWSWQSAVSRLRFMHFLVFLLLFFLKNGSTWQVQKFDLLDIFHCTRIRQEELIQYVTNVHNCGFVPMPDYFLILSRFGVYSVFIWKKDKIERNVKNIQLEGSFFNLEIVVWQKHSNHKIHSFWFSEALSCNLWPSSTDSQLSWKAIRCTWKL